MWPHELQYTRLSCPSLFPRVYSDSCPLCQWWHPTILCGPLLLPSLFSSIRVFSNESAVSISWPKYWSFSFIIIPSSEYSGFISFRIDWLDLLAVQGTLKSLLKHHNAKASVLLYGPAQFVYGPPQFESIQKPRVYNWKELDMT